MICPYCQKEITKHKYIVTWLDKTTTEIEGYDPADAFRRAGIGAGALRAMDYWKEVKEAQREQR